MSAVLKSDFAGIDSSGVYYPKSIKNLRGLELQFALKGMLNAWIIAQTNTGIIRTEKIKLDGSKYSEFYSFLLLYWIRRFNLEIAAFLAPEFREHESKQMFLKGRVDLVKLFCSEFKGAELITGRYNDLSFDFDHLKVLKDGYRDLLAKINVDEPLARDLFNLTCQGLDLLRAVPSSDNPKVNALRLYNNFISGHGKEVLPPKAENLYDAIQFFSKSITKNTTEALPSDGELEGLLFNLNYLLEYIVRKALRSTYSDLKTQERLFANDQINNIRVVRGNGSLSRRQMKPDCLGVFANMNPHLSDEIRNFFESKIYIFDAKHKIIGGDDDAIELSRSDFYQIISYSTTHFNPDARNGVYGLVGLEAEQSICSDDHYSSRNYIGLGKASVSALVRIESDQQSVEVANLGFKFGQFLYDLGRSPETNHDAIYGKLGENILNAVMELNLVRLK
jgi:hypothetical protein